MKIKEGYDVTIAGKVTDVIGNYVRVKVKNGDPFWVEVSDIKTYAPCKWRTEDGKE